MADFRVVILLGGWTECSGLLSARKLRKLSLSYLKEDLLSLPVRWSQLTHLNLNFDGSAQFRGNSKGLSYGDVINVLRRCPLLVSCGLSVGSTTYGIVQQPDHEVQSEYTLTLPLLENLFLELSGGRDECHLKHLDLPRLRHLEIKFQETFSGSHASRPSWVDFLSRNGGSMKQLFIDIPSLTRDELIGFLESVPLLIHLRITNYSGPPSVVDDEVIDRLTPSGENSDCLCPMLEEFQCIGSHCVSFSEAQLLSLVQKRSKSEKVRGLKQVYVTFDRREPKEFDEFLDSLTGTGMKVSQRSPTGTIILPESNNSTAVNINHAEWPSQWDSFSPWDGLYLEYY